MSLVDHKLVRYPFSIVWTPIPLLTWLFPFIGHMGIADSNGVIRDFAGPYHVSVSRAATFIIRSLIDVQEDDMAFGKPTRYLPLDVSLVAGGAEAWDRAVREASEVYKGRMHNLLWDNCHSHVGMALNQMNYNNSSFNMVKLAAWVFFRAKYTGLRGVLLTWSPFTVLIVTILICIFLL